MLPFFVHLPASTHSMNRMPARTVLHLYKIVHVLLVNKFLDYLVSYPNVL